MPKNQRDALIESGLHLFHSRGYGNTGTREIAAAAGIPQGSFTNHFRSKEVLGVAALDHYVERLETVMEATLADRSRSPAERLNAYFDVIESKLSDAQWQLGCLIPDLAAEAPAHSELVRKRLTEVVQRQSACFEAVLGKVYPEDEANDLGAFVIAAWHGTLLRMKVEQSPVPIRRFRRVLDRLMSRT